MKVYISGPITGKPDGNRSAFIIREKELIDAGHHPVNPHNICSNLPMHSDWSIYMRLCLKYLMDCEAVSVLPDWHLSRGARIEVLLATQLNIPLFEVGA